MMKFIDEDIYKDQSGIYMIENTISGLIYIGQTRQKFLKRYRHHRWLLRKGTHDNNWLQASYNKYGEDAFTFSVIEVVTDFELLNKLEIKYIAEAKANKKCCNMSEGGEGAKGIPLPEYRKRELGELNRILNTGKKASDETRAKMSAARKGKKRSADCLKKVRATKNAKLLSGIKFAQTKLSPEDVANIKIGLMNNVSYEALADEFDISVSNINAIRSNRSWKFVQVDGWQEYCDTHQNNVAARQSRSAN